MVIKNTKLGYEVTELVDVVAPGGTYIATGEVCRVGTRQDVTRFGTVYRRTFYRIRLDSGVRVEYPASWVRGADVCRLAVLQPN